MTVRAARFLVVLLVLAACATPATQDAGSPTTDTSAAPATEAPTGTDAPATTQAPATEESPTTTPPVPVPDGPAAPDFTLAMGDGTSFTLSEEARPVFMVFWAEW